MWDRERGRDPSGGQAEERLPGLGLFRVDDVGGGDQPEEAVDPPGCSKRAVDVGLETVLGSVAEVVELVALALAGARPTEPG